MRSLHTTLPRLWLQRGPKVWPLLPLAWLYGALVGLRRLAFARGWLASGHPGVPVVVVGNVVAGGGETSRAGRAEFQHGFRPGHGKTLGRPLGVEMQLGRLEDGLEHRELALGQLGQLLAVVRLLDLLRPQIGNLPNKHIYLCLVRCRLGKSKPRGS